MYYRSTTALMFALNNYSGIVVSAGYICASRYSRNGYSPRSQVNAIHAGRRIRNARTYVHARVQHARGIRKCAELATLRQWRHCPSHQFARFMRGFNEVIGLAGAINI